MAKYPTTGNRSSISASIVTVCDAGRISATVTLPRQPCRCGGDPVRGYIGLVHALERRSRTSRGGWRVRTHQQSRDRRDRSEGPDGAATRRIAHVRRATASIGKGIQRAIFLGAETLEQRDRTCCQIARSIVQQFDARWMRDDDRAAVRNVEIHDPSPQHPAQTRARRQWPSLMTVRVRMVGRFGTQARSADMGESSAKVWTERVTACQQSRTGAAQRRLRYLERAR